MAQIKRLHAALADVQASSNSSALRIEAVATSLTSAAELAATAAAAAAAATAATTEQNRRRADAQFASVMAQLAKITGPPEQLVTDPGGVICTAPAAALAEAPAIELAVAPPPSAIFVRCPVGCYRPH